jgi:signal peptidase II
LRGRAAPAKGITVTEVAQPAEQSYPDSPENIELSGESGFSASVPRTANRRALVILAVVAAAVLVVDLISKQLVVGHLREGEPVRWLGGAIYLSYIRNPGAAFSFGTGITWIFPLITVAVIAGIAVLSRTLRSIGWAIAFGLVVGGAFGNLADRVFRAPGPMRGHVVDFISLFSPDGSHFAIFNLADSALSCGVALALLLEVLGRHRDGTRAQAAASTRGGSDSARLTA